MISVSVVSHGNGEILEKLFTDLESCSEVTQIILTKNIPEYFFRKKISNKILIIENIIPKGFATNHNEAFRRATGKYFAIVNPDIRLEGNPFPNLLDTLDRISFGVVAPLVINSAGYVEDSAREFPTPYGIFCKLIGRDRSQIVHEILFEPIEVPWVAGMFFMMRANDYRVLGGLDERYFLYYEDVDLCVRVWRQGGEVVLSPLARVIHDASRSSHYNPLYLQWHIKSMCRYFLKHAWRLPNKLVRSNNK